MDQGCLSLPVCRTGRCISLHELLGTDFDRAFKGSTAKFAENHERGGDFRWADDPWTRLSGGCGSTFAVVGFFEVQAGEDLQEAAIEVAEL